MSNQEGKWRRRGLALAALALIAVFVWWLWPAKQSAVVEVASPTWDPRARGWQVPVGEPIGIDPALEYYDNLMRIQGEAPLASPPTHGTGAVDPATLPEVLPPITAEIKELARGLNNDPLAIFNYVYNHVEYEPYYGQRRGPTLTLLDGFGNDFDIASLLVSLLRVSGYEATYVLGRMTLPLASLANWLGVDADIGLVATMLKTMGIPYQQKGTQFTLSRVWVWLFVDGVKYKLDASFKSYQRFPVTDLSPLMGYDRDALLEAVQNGATVTDDTLQNMNSTALRNKLDEYAASLAAGIREKYMTAELDELLGGRRIVPKEFAELPGALAFSASPDQLFEEIPTAYTDTFRISGHGIDHTFRAFEFGGNRVTISFTIGEFRPQLRLDGTLIAEGDPLQDGEFTQLTLFMDHALAAFDGQYLDQERNLGLQAGAGHTYAIVYAIGTSLRPLNRAQRRLAKTADAELDDKSEARLGEGLHITGLTYVRQYTLARTLIAQVQGFRYLTHHNFGLVTQTDSAVIDWIGSSTTLLRRATDVPAKRRFAAFIAGLGIASAFEHATIEQTGIDGVVGFSTIRALHFQNEAGGRVLYLHKDNLAAFESSLAKTYPPNTLENFEKDVADNHWLLVPENGQQVIEDLTGYGYINSGAAGIGYFIKGNLNGGLCCSNSCYVSFKEIRLLDCSDVNTVQEADIPTVPNPRSADPVDMQTGFFLYEQTDIDLGPALAFRRSYNSGRADVPSTIGNGWTHNLDNRVTKTTRSFPALGTRTPIDVVALLVQAEVSVDLIENLVGCDFTYCDTPKQDALGHMVVVMTTNWFTDRLTQNAIVVQLGAVTHEFIKLPDGSFAAPPGLNTTLIENSDGTVQVVERNGPTALFDADGRLATVTDENGLATTYSYDAGGRIAKVADHYGRFLSVSYNASGKIQSVSDSGGRSVNYTYQADDLTQVTDVGGSSHKFAYEDHNLVKVIDAAGLTTAENTYDALRRVTGQRTPRQQGFADYKFRFTEFRTEEETVSDGRRTVNYYDQKGRVVAVIDGLGFTSRLTYDGQNNVVSHTDKAGAVWKTEYDQRNNVVRREDPLGSATVYTIDDADRRVAETNALAAQTTYTFDEQSQCTAIVDAQGNETFNTYDALGRAVKNTNLLGIDTVMTYDAVGNPKTAKFGTLPPITYEYDERGNLLSLTDQAGAVTSFTYNDRNQATSVTDPLGKTASLAYDANGRMKSFTDRKGQTTTYTYTASGEPEAITYPNGDTVTYSYDEHNDLTAVAEPLGTSTFAYDKLKRIVQETDIHGVSVGYTFDAYGRLKTVAYPGDKAVTYEYDARGQLISVRNWLGQTATYTYDAVGRCTTQTHFNGAATTYEYDPLNRLLALETRTSADGLIAAYKFTLDKANQRTSVVQTPPMWPVFTAGSATYAYDDKGHRLSSAGAHTYVHDVEGNLIDRSGARQFTYDDHNRLTAIKGDLDLDFVYDETGRRVRRIEGGVETRYVFDTGGNIIAETDAAGVVLRYYIYGAGLLACVTPSGRVFDYHFDANGNTVAMTDGAERIVNRYAYTPFGALANSVERVPQPFTFVGRHGVLREPDGLYKMGARYYDARIGRFISEHPSGFTNGQLNLYIYGGSNPISLTDPFGVGTYGIAVNISTPGIVHVEVALRVDDNYNYAAQATEEGGKPEDLRGPSPSGGASAAAYLTVYNNDAVDTPTGSESGTILEDTNGADQGSPAVSAAPRPRGRHRVAAAGAGSKPPAGGLPVSARRFRTYTRTAPGLSGPSGGFPRAAGRGASYLTRTASDFFSRSTGGGK